MEGPKENSVITIGDLKIFKDKEYVLGNGFFGTVLKGQWRQKPCAVKVLSAIGQELLMGFTFVASVGVQENVLKKFKQECTLMTGIEHPNIVTYYDTVLYPDCSLPVLVMELMDTSLSKHIAKTDLWPMRIQLRISGDIASALVCLHNHGLIHRDLCGDNVLLDCRGAIPQAKLSDFGMSRVIHKNPKYPQYLSQIGHREGYLPPEARDDPADYDSSLDVFMFGAVMTQIANKVTNIKNKEQRQMLVSQLKEHPLEPYIQQCFRKEKSERPKASVLHDSLRAKSFSWQRSQSSSESSATDLDSITRGVDPLQILVELITGKTISLTAQPSDTVDSIKAKIHELEGLSPEEQQLTYAGKQFQDGSKLSDYDIWEDSTLHLILKSNAQRDQLQIRVQKKIVTLQQVQDSDTIRSIKAQIQAKTAISPEYQQLCFDEQLLSNENTIGYYRIPKESVLHLINICQICVSIEMMKNDIILLVNYDLEIIENIKSRIQKQDGIPPDSLQILYQGKELHDKCTLKDYSVRKEETIHLLAKNVGHIFVKTQTGRTIVLEVKSSDMIESIKEKIQQKGGFPAQQQQLMFDGKLLEDGYTLSDYRLNIFQQMTLQLVQKAKLFVKLLTGELIALQVNHLSTMESIIKEIPETFLQGIPPEQQQICFNGNMLDDSLTVTDCNIQNESTLYLYLRPGFGAFLQSRSDGADRVSYLHTICDRHVECSKQLHDNNQMIECLQQRIESLLQDLDATKEQVVQLQSENSALESDLKELQAEKQQLQERIYSHQQESLALDITPWKVARDKVELGKVIGGGGWGAVSEGRMKVAVKQIYPNILSQSNLVRLKREMQMLALIRHPNLVQFIAAVFDDHDDHCHNPPYIVTELLDINLRTAYEHRRLAKAHQISVFTDIAQALHYLHHRHEPIIHRDVSSANVLLQQQPNDTWIAKLSDLGSANLAREAYTLNEGSLVYCAPEAFTDSVDKVHSDEILTTKIDVYSYGILLCEVISARFPVRNRLPTILREIRTPSPQMYQLIILCIENDPRHRPCMADVLKELQALPNSYNETGENRDLYLTSPRERGAENIGFPVNRQQYKNEYMNVRGVSEQFWPTYAPLPQPPLPHDTHFMYSPPPLSSNDAQLYQKKD